MNTFVRILIGLAFSTYSGFWRYWFGGAYPKWIKDNVKPSIRRFAMNMLNAVIMFWLFRSFRNMTVSESIMASLLMQTLFWNLTFGMFMDVGRDNDTSPEDEEEYSKSWFNQFLQWMFRRDEWYGRLYDFTGLVIIFITPCVAMSLLFPFGMGFCLLGLIIPYLYEMGEVMYDKGLNDRHWILASLAEFGSGFTTGLFLSFS